jgi:hypothetical protein
MKSLTRPNVAGRWNNNPAFTTHVDRCCTNAERWAAQSRKTMGSGYSADRAGYRTSIGGNSGHSAAGSGIKSSTHRVIR